MKRFFLFFCLFLAGAMAICAEVRTDLDMARAAARVLKRQHGFRAPQTSIGTVGGVKTLARYGQMSALGYTDGGFALVSHDTALPDVLLYTDTPYADLDMCPALKSHIERMATYLEQCADEGIVPAFLSNDVTLGHPEGVPEIMTCRWNQYAPYNFLCPMLYLGDNETRAITGCVATAMAQVIYTLYKQKGTMVNFHGAQRYHFTDDNHQRVVAHLYYPALTFNWDDLCDTYNGTSDSYSKAMAVASLMYACGMSVTTSYSAAGSGAQFAFIPEGISKFFGGLEANYYATLADHHQLVYDEIDAGRPVLFGGERSDMGAHAFVGDGYDSEGLIHINLGWGGGSNCYSAITDLWGFSSNQLLCTFHPTTAEHKFSNAAPLAELQGLYATADLYHPATQIEEGRWYVLYNMGRCTSIYSQATGKVPQNVKYIPAADKTENVAAMLIRFLQKDDDMYYIQTGTGDYFGGLTYNGAKGTTTSPSTAYLVGHIGQDAAPFFWMKESGITLDCNYDGGGIFGWKNATPTDSLATNSWQLYPVTLTQEPTVTFTDTLSFNPEHTYTMQCYDGRRNYGFLMKSSANNLSSSNKTELHILRADNGWTITAADDDTQFLSAKSKDFKTGNGTISTDVPLTLYFERVEPALEDEVGLTDDPDLNATSALYRIRCEAGYLATQKMGIGSPVYCNLGPQTTYGLWLITDRTAYNEIHPNGINAPSISPLGEVSKNNDKRQYDILGRPASGDAKGVEIVTGKKVLK